MFKQLLARIHQQRWPVYIEKPMVALVYLCALSAAALLFVLCCFVVLVLSPMAWHWLRAL
ncbi:hypothetical protein PQR62_01365 [Herbaspirillum lusitanum]|uniref:Uncharacterized protein n=1 Tax=Herbaspirillum lusitanum TaxID=213312 RepID=A0ABW9A4W8_9BURK